MLTNVVSAAYDSYEKISTPGDDQSTAYTDLNKLSGEWSNTCMDKTDPSRVGDDLTCFAMVERISTAALLIDPSLAD